MSIKFWLSHIPWLSRETNQDKNLVAEGTVDLQICWQALSINTLPLNPEKANPMLMDKAMLLESPLNFQHQYLIVQLVECMFFGKTWRDAMSSWHISHAEQVSGLDWFVSKSHRSDFIVKTSRRFVMYTKCSYNLGLMTLIELGLLLLLPLQTPTSQFYLIFV